MKPHTEVRQYYYRPLAFNPSVFKCAGHGAEFPSHRKFYTAWFNAAQPDDGHAHREGFVPGVVILKGYRGDRISKVGSKWQEVK